MAVSLHSNTLYQESASLLPEQDSFDNGLSGNGTAATGQRKSTRQRIMTKKFTEYAGDEHLKVLSRSLTSFVRL